MLKALTAAQVAVLEALDAADQQKAAPGHGLVHVAHWHDVHYLPVRDDYRPRESLEECGLIELRVVDKPLSFSKRPRDVTQARLTEAGVAMLRSRTR